jgi:hypothetical protein
MEVCCDVSGGVWGETGLGLAVFSSRFLSCFEFVSGASAGSKMNLLALHWKAKVTVSPSTNHRLAIISRNCN